MDGYIPQMLHVSFLGASRPEGSFHRSPNRGSIRGSLQAMMPIEVPTAGVALQ